MIIFEFFIYTIVGILSIISNDASAGTNDQERTFGAVMFLLLLIYCNIISVFNKHLQGSYGFLIVLVIVLTFVIYFFLHRKRRYQSIIKKFEHSKNVNMIILGKVLVYIYIVVSLYFFYKTI